MIDGIQQRLSHEMPLFIRAGDASLFGVLTEPAVNRSKGGEGTTVVSLPGGGTPLGMNVNGLGVQLSRRLSDRGFHAFRLDYHGNGDSTGPTEPFHLGSPFTTDVLSTLDALRARGLGPFVLVGDCFGGRTALAAAEQTTAEEILGVVLISAPIRDFEFGERMVTKIASEPGIWSMIRRSMRVRHLKGLLSSKQRRLAKDLVLEKSRALTARRSEGSTSESRYRISANFTSGLECMRRRRAPTLVVYGQEEDLFKEFSRERAALADTLDDPNARIEVVTVPGNLHGFTELAGQDRVLDLMVEWITRLGSDDTSPRPVPEAGREVR